MLKSALTRNKIGKLRQMEIIQNSCRESLTNFTFSTYIRHTYMHGPTITEGSWPIKTTAWQSSFQPTNKVQEPTKERQHTRERSVSLLARSSQARRTQPPHLPKLHTIFACVFGFLSHTLCLSLFLLCGSP